MGYLLFSLFILLLLTINQKNQISAQSSGNLWSNTFQEVNNEIESNIESILLYKRLNNSSGIKPLMSDIEFNKVNVSSTSNSHRKLDPVELEENDQLRTLSQKLFNHVPPFNPAKNTNVSKSCVIATKFYLYALKNLDFWALRLYDATAKFTPSGILSGNVNQYGNFDECLAISGPLKTLNGKYCLANLQLRLDAAEGKDRLKHLLKYIQSHSAFKSDFNDPGHRVPRFSMINWGLCVPAGCSHEDVELSVRDYIAEFSRGTGIEFQVRVEEDMCQVNEEITYDTMTKLVLGFFIAIIIIVIISTIYDWTFSDAGDDWFNAFSLKKNFKTLFNVTKSQSDIPTLHGIRFLNAILLLFAHKSMALFFNPYVNRTEMSEDVGQNWSVIGRAAAIFTDPFLMMSGLLTSYAIIGRLQRNQSIRLYQEYMGRFLRIVPTFGALILFCTYILPLMGSGPQWSLVVTEHANMCKKHWWKNMLFIHNYFGFGKMCLTHTHHLGIDTELFWVAPAMILLLWKNPRKGTIILTSVAVIATIGRFITTIYNELSSFVYFGVSIKRLFDTADYMYSQPFYRSTVYICGIFLGYFLRRFKHLKLSSKQITVGWIVTTTLFLIAFLGPAPMGKISYEYNSYHAAMYAAFAPLAWCGLFVWIIILAQNGYTNFVTDFLSWRGFQVTTRISYSLYLTQFPIFFYNVGRTRAAGYYQFIPLMLNLSEHFCIIIASILLTILFEIPSQNIKKIIFSSKKEAIHTNNNHVEKLADLTKNIESTKDHNE